MGWIEIVELLGGLVLLVLGGDWLVRGATNIAYSIQISPLVVGLTVVAFGTSAPELIISLQSAFNNASDIAMGNVVGSNICNLALVLGITAMFYPIRISDNSIKVDWLMAMGSALLLYFFVSRDFTVNQFEGVILILIVVIYTYFQIEMSRKETIGKLKSKGENLSLSEIDAIAADEEVPDIKGKALFKEIGFLLLGCVALFFGAQWFVNGAISTAEFFNVDRAVIGLTVVALGTSLPELVTSAVAAYHKNTDLAIGNLLGSCIFNILSILGFTSIVHIIGVDPEVIQVDMLWMMGVTFVTLPLMLLRKKIGKGEGAILLLVYVLYIYNLLQRGVDLPL